MPAETTVIPMFVSGAEVAKVWAAPVRPVWYWSPKVVMAEVSQPWVVVDTQIGAPAVYINMFPAEAPTLEVVAMFPVPFPRRMELE